MKPGSEFRIPFVWKLAAAAVLLVAMFAIALKTGAADTSVREVWEAMRGAKGDKASMIRGIRLPRELAAIAVGAALAVAGAIMQGMTRNPLADPGLLGLTAGANAALALTIAFYPEVRSFGIMLACFGGAAFGSLLVFGIGAVRRGGFSPLRIVLAGAAVSAFLYAVADGVGIFYRISKDVSMWTSGGLIGTTWGQLRIITPFIAGGILVSLLLSKALTILSLSEEVAVGLGQNTTRIKTVLMLVIVVLAGASVALIGNMAFVGLLIPHLVRPLVGQDYRVILPMSALLGAAFMLFADTLGRTIHAPFETPVAAIVAVLGLPFFLWIVNKGGRSAL